MLLVLYCEAHADDIDGRTKSNDRWTEDGINSFSSGRQIDEHISSAWEDSTVKLESSSASGDSNSTVELEIPSASEGPTVKLETTDTEQLGESRNCSASGRNVAERNCFAEGDVSTMAAEVSDYAKTFRQKHELTQSAIVHGGAVWDIFRCQDVPKLMEYLRKHKKEFRHVENHPVNSVIHPIHDQTFFLNEKHKKQLKREFVVGEGRGEGRERMGDKPRAPFFLLPSRCSAPTPPTPSSSWRRERPPSHSSPSQCLVLNRLPLSLSRHLQKVMVPATLVTRLG